MATDLQNLTTIRSNLLSKLATISADPKPSYNIDGQSVDYNAYYAALWGQLEQVNKQISTAGGPFEVETLGEA